MSDAERLFAGYERDFLLLCEGCVAEVRPKSESKIEELMGAALILGFRHFVAARNANYPFLFGRNDPSFSICLEQQYKWQNFRIDFAIFLNKPFKPQVIFVECDGHDFHERTKEQAERDRARDRAIQEAGIPILRFTGREIYRDPAQCSIQILSFITKRGQE